MIYIDKYAYISGLRDASPIIKALFAIITLCICISSGKLIVSGFIFASMFLVITVKAKIPVHYYLKLLLIPMSFLLLSVLGIVVNISATIPETAFLKLWKIYIFIQPDGIKQAIFLSAKSIAAVSCLYFLILTTPFRDIIHLLHMLKLPRVLIEQLTLVYRFIFILMEKVLIKRSSQLCRFGYTAYNNSLKSFAMLFASVFVDAFEEADHVYNAMLSRGYDGTMRFLPKNFKADKLSWIKLICFEALTILLSAWR